MGNGRYGSQRKTAYREVLPIIVVVCDDTRTAVAYFQEMRRDFKSTVTLKIIPAPRTGATAMDVVQKAIQVKTSTQSPEDTDEVWALLDLEAIGKDNILANNAKREGEKEGIRVVQSNPCFEVWILAHLVNTGRAFSGCREVLTEVKKEWKTAFGVDFGNQKSRADYSKLTQLRAQAIKCCRARGPHNSPSWTEVYNLVESIMAKSVDNGRGQIPPHSTISPAGI